MLMDPPEASKVIAQSCQNLRIWPVLVGNEGKCDTMLSSPIILYDYPLFPDIRRYVRIQRM